MYAISGGGDHAAPETKSLHSNGSSLNYSRYFKERQTSLDFSGSSFNYSRYFNKRRNKLCRNRKIRANEFVERLEIAIVVSVRMIGGELNKLLNLRRMSKNQQCNVCHSIVFDEGGRSIQYFQAKKVCGENNPSGFNLEWIREDFNSAKQLGENHWISGLLVLCNECLKCVSWCEAHAKLKDAEHNIRGNKFELLPKICNAYYSLQKSFHLGKFFEEQTKLMLRDPEKNAVQLSEMRNCITNCSTEIANIGDQISKIGQTDPTYAKTKHREVMIQRNIGQYSIDRSWDLRYLISTINSDYSDIMREDNQAGDEHKEWTVLDQVKHVICYPIHFVDETLLWYNKHELK